MVRAEHQAPLNFSIGLFFFFIGLFCFGSHFFATGKRAGSGKGSYKHILHRINEAGHPEKVAEYGWFLDSMFRHRPSNFDAQSVAKFGSGDI
jgi:hypothetical protein